MGELPKLNNKNTEYYSVRVTSELKRKQIELNDANINVSQIVREAIDTAWHQLNTTDHEWMDEK